VLSDSKNITEEILSTSMIKESNDMMENVNCFDYKGDNEKTNLIKTTNNDQTISKTNPYSNKEDKKIKKM